MIEAIEYANKNDDRIIKYLEDRFLVQMVSLLDGHGTMIINTIRKLANNKNTLIDGIFKKGETKHQEKSKVWNTPFGSFETY